MNACSIKHLRYGKVKYLNTTNSNHADSDSENMASAEAESMWYDAKMMMMVSVAIQVVQMRDE